MGRKLLAIVTGMITALGIIWVTYMISTMMAPHYPKNLEYMGVAELQDYWAQVHASTYGVVVAGYVVAAFAAGFISTKMGRRWGGGYSLAIICGALLTAWEIVSVFVWAQPSWFIIASVVLLIPMALVGYKFAHRWGHTHVLAT